MEREYKWEKATRQVTTTCTNCAVGCQMIAEVNNFDKVIRFRDVSEWAPNLGQACFKGKFGYDYPNHRSRIKRPYFRKGRYSHQCDDRSGIRSGCGSVVEGMLRMK